MESSFDLVIVGAGPAGLAAAVTAAALRLKTAVIDEQPAPGGQVYRNIEAMSEQGNARHILGDDYMAGAALVQQFRASGALYMPRTQVWQVDRQRRVWFRSPAGMGSYSAHQVLVATGAMERPVPIPGWTLPGVMTCGAAQTLLKGSGLAPDSRAVLAGSGPLLLLLALQLVRAGVRPAVVLETETHLWQALPHFLPFVTAPGYLGKGLAMLRALRRGGVKVERQVRDLRVLGDSKATAVEYCVAGEVRRVDADLVLLHQGVVPNNNLALSMRCEHEWSDAQRAFRPRLGPWCVSSVDGVLVAGDSGGIAGAKAAELSGRLAALSAASRIARISPAERDSRGAIYQAELKRHLAARPFLDAYYRPPQEILAPRGDDTIVCRCEEVRAGDIRRLVVEQKCPGPNQMKSFVRSGMGPCQGRLCGLTVVELMAECRNVTPAEIGYYRIRPPIKPLTVADLASAPVSGAD